MYNWFKIFNIAEFDALKVPSVNYSMVFENIGEVTVLVTKGNTYNILYEDVFLSLNLNDNNPFVRDERAIYSDENGDVWLGIENAS